MTIKQRSGVSVKAVSFYPLLSSSFILSQATLQRKFFSFFLLSGRLPFSHHFLHLSPLRAPCYFSFLQPAKVAFGFFFFGQETV